MSRSNLLSLMGREKTSLRPPRDFFQQIPVDSHHQAEYPPAVAIKEIKKFASFPIKLPWPDRFPYPSAVKRLVYNAIFQFFHRIAAIAQIFQRQIYSIRRRRRPSDRGGYWSVAGRFPPAGQLQRRRRLPAFLDREIPKYECTPIPRPRPRAGNTI